MTARSANGGTGCGDKHLPDRLKLGIGVLLKLLYSDPVRVKYRHQPALAMSLYFALKSAIALALRASSILARHSRNSSAGSFEKVGSDIFALFDG
jgi:hypothetical protein